MLPEHPLSATSSDEASGELADGYHNVGRWLVIDGTPIEAEVSHFVPVNGEHRRMLARRTGAR